MASKKKRTKKYEPSNTFVKIKQEWLNSLWVSDSCMHEEVVIHNALEIWGRKLQPPKNLLVRWIDELPITKYNWRFLLFSFDPETEEVETAIFKTKERGTSLEVCNLIAEDLSEFVAARTGENMRWGWAAVPSLEVDLSLREDFFIDFFVGIGATDSNVRTVVPENIGPRPLN